MKNQKAFSLIELLATLVVAGILATVALPNLRNFVMQNRMTARTNELVKAINLARLESISHPGVPTFVVPNPDWSTGCKIVRTNAVTKALEDLKIFNFGNDQISITPVNQDSKFKIEYASRGRIRLPTTETTSIEFTLCNQTNRSRGRKVTIFATGRVSSESIETCP